jgi:cell division protein ZapA (FtsZ GTPase activity inhibitor)
MNELPATVYILDRPYKLKVRPDDEHFLRKAAETIDSQARSYGKMYAYNDRQDLLAMVALTQITQLLELQDRLQYKDIKLASRLTDINELLDTKVVL